MQIETMLPITEARKRIFYIAERVQRSDVFYTLTQRGKPKAVILSAKKYEFLNNKKNERFILADRYYSEGVCQFNQIFPKALIIRDESRVVYLSNNDAESKYQEEGLIKAQLYVEIVEKYKYPLNLVEYGRYVKVGGKSSKRYIEADIIINDEKGNVRMIFEVSPFSDYEKNMDAIVADLFILADSLNWVKKPEYLVYYSRNSRNGEAKEKILVIDYLKFNTFYAWKKSGRPGKEKIPKFEQGI